MDESMELAGCSVIENGVSDNSCKLDEQNRDSAPNVCSNSNLDEELDDETQQKLRGDAIGDTLYSEKFVLTTLMQLIKNEWNTKFEEDLCALWDMTLEPAVRDYLFRKDFPKIAVAAINTTEQPRLVEILVGILGNICSTPNNDFISNVDQITDIVNLIYCNDKETLIQVVRFMKVVAFGNTNLTFMNNDVMKQLLTFTDSELNVNTCQLLNELTTDNKLPESLISGQLLEFAFLSLKSNFETDEFEKLHISDWESNKRNRLINCLNIFSNYCSYINSSLNNRLYEASLIPCSELFIFLNSFVIKDMSDNQNCLIPIASDLEFVIETVTFISRIINRLNYVSNYFCYFLKMLKCSIEFESDKSNIFIEFLLWYVSSFVDPIENLRLIILGEFSKDDAILLIGELVKKAPNFPDIDCLEKFDQLRHCINFFSTDLVHTRS